MSIYPTQSNRQPRSVRDDRGQVTGHSEEPSTGGCAAYAVLLLAVLAVVALCAVGFFLARALFSDSGPATLPALVAGTSLPFATGPGPAATSDQAQITINPEQGYVNTLITVTGQGWWPGEPVFVSLRSRAEGEGPGYAYAAAVADDSGNIHAAFTFPNEMRWIGEEWADVIARGTRSGLEASTRFTLIAPTPTHTLPPPTAGPTRAPTSTPLPTDTPPPTDTPLPTPTPTPEVIITDWLGEYFANPTLTGDPVLIRNDVTVDFNWGTGSPGPGIPTDRFSARWTRRRRFPEGLYRFTITADDGVRFWIDGQLYVDEWRDGTMTDYAFDIHLSKGKRTLHLEYYENLGGAVVQLRWAQIEQPTPTLPPTDTPSPTPGPTDTPPATSQALPDRWRAEYYANPAFLGQPVLLREDAEINFDWGTGSPGPGIPVDGFAARWTGEQWMSGGTYRYSLLVDDGARFWIDGQLIIDAWLSIPDQTYVVGVQLTDGVHAFRVDYFEATLDAYIHLGGEAVTNPMSLSPSPGF